MNKLFWAVFLLMVFLCAGDATGSSGGNSTSNGAEGGSTSANGEQGLASNGTEKVNDSASGEQGSPSNGTGEGSVSPGGEQGDDSAGTKKGDESEEDEKTSNGDDGVAGPSAGTIQNKNMKFLILYIILKKSKVFKNFCNLDL